MATLSGTTPAATYPSLIKFNDNNAISASLRLLSDGSGAATPLYLSDSQINIGSGSGSINATLGLKGGGSTSATSSLIVQNSNGTELMSFNNAGGMTISNPTSSVDGITIGGFGTINLRKIYGGGYAANFLALDGFSITYNQGYSSGGHIFKVNSAEAVRISSNKNLLIGTTTDIASSNLTVDSTTQGILPPRMTTIQKNAIATPAAGLIVYDTTTNKLCCYNGTIWNDLF
jgi:hypothetical protein